jgi:hypothetical protein
MFSLKLYMLPNLLSHIIGCDIKGVTLWLGIVSGDSFWSTTGSTQSTLNDDITGDTPGQQWLTKQNLEY